VVIFNGWAVDVLAMSDSRRCPMHFQGVMVFNRWVVQLRTALSYQVVGYRLAYTNMHIHKSCSRKIIELAL
jgi:hypothetical protein